MIAILATSNLSASATSHFGCPWVKSHYLVRLAFLVAQARKEGARAPPAARLHRRIVSWGSEWPRYHIQFQNPVDHVSAKEIDSVARLFFRPLPQNLEATQAMIGEQAKYLGQDWRGRHQGAHLIEGDS